MGRTGVPGRHEGGPLDGLTVSGHVPLAMSWIEASNLGMRTIEHIQTIFENEQPDPKLLAEQFPAIADRLMGPHGDSIWATLKRNHTFFDPTLIGYEVNLDKAGPEIAARRRVAYARMKLLAGRSVRAGVPILAGTDVLERHGDMLLLELERLVEIGMTPQQALAAATTTASEAVLHHGTGRIEVGAPAMFLVLDANPLTDIKNLRALSAVVLSGTAARSDRAGPSARPALGIAAAAHSEKICLRAFSNAWSTSRFAASIRAIVPAEAPPISTSLIASSAPRYQSVQARRICSSLSRVLSRRTAATLSAVSFSSRSSAARRTSSTTNPAVSASAEASASAVVSAHTADVLDLAGADVPDPVSIGVIELIGEVPEQHPGLSGREKRRVVAAALEGIGAAPPSRCPAAWSRQRFRTKSLK